MIEITPGCKRYPEDARTEHQPLCNYLNQRPYICWVNVFKYAYQNLSLEDMPEEKWEEIPGLENYYKISNKGRVRRLAHISIDKRGMGRKRPEMILTQTVGSAYNSHTKDHKFYLRFAVTIQGKVYNMTTGRLVYHCFVEKFDLKNRDLFIFCKDDDPYNMCAENLYLATQADKQARMERENRRGTPFLDMSPEKRKAVQQKINQIKAKRGVYEISQYDLDGLLIRTYPNAEVAARIMKTTAKHISNAAVRKSVLTAAGYLWRRGKAPTIDISEVLQAPGIHMTPLAKHLERIGQYDLQGNLIRTFPTIREASNTLGINYGRIQAVVKGKHHTYKGFIWREGNTPKIDVKNIVKGKGYRLSPLSAHERKITQYSFEGLRVRTFKHVAEAARLTGIDSKSIDLVVKGKMISAGGFLWQRGESLHIDLKPLKKMPNFNLSALSIHIRKKREGRKQKRI